MVHVTEPRQIAVVTAEQGYAGILAVLRDRANELKASRQTLGDIAGLQPGYMEKILAGIKGLGKESTGPTLGVLGLKIVFFEDVGALARVASRLSARDESQVRMLSDGKHSGVVVKFTLRRMRKLAKLGGAARARKLTKRRRKQIAKQAANKRWSTPRIVEITPKDKPQ